MANVNNHMQSWWIIAISISTSVAGQTAIKLGVSMPNTNLASTGILNLMRMIVQSPLVLFGLLLYGIGAIAWIAVLSRLDLSDAYPFLALNFVLITLTSRVILGETISTVRWLGIVVICFGIILVSRNGS